MIIFKTDRLYPIELCRYTLRKSLGDEGSYPSFNTAQEILEDLE